MSKNNSSSFLKQNSRAQRLCNIACGVTQTNSNASDYHFRDGQCHELLNSRESNRALAESPLPPGANLMEIEALSQMLEEDFSKTLPTLPNNNFDGDLIKSTRISPSKVEEDEVKSLQVHPQLMPYLNNSTLEANLTHSVDFNSSVQVTMLPTVNNNTSHSEFVNNDTENIFQNQSITRNDPGLMQTPRPLSPGCNINHLHIDCENDFCPYYIGNDIVREPLSQLSNFSGYSTPQANTPLSCYSPDVPLTGRQKARKDKGNVRRRHEHEWIDTKRKTLRNLGKEYVSRKGVTKPKKTLKSPCKCRMKCSEKISESQRENIFNSFWKLGDNCRQWTFVSNLVTKHPKKRILVDVESRRKHTIKYSLPLPDPDENSQLNYTDVCKKQFLATLAVSEQFVYTAIEKTDTGTGFVTTDRRGKHTNHPRKLTEDIKKSVCDHIRCLQPVESHYVRKDSSKLYLDSTLNFHKLYAMYNEWFDPNAYSEKAETERHYRTIVNDNFKISFFKPKKDQCDTCHKYTNIETPTEEERKGFATHVSNKNTARELKAEDKRVAQTSNGKIITATFDFQKVLNSPYGEISVFYYKRKLGTMNFTVFDLAKKKASCYMWHEGEGKRGANEVASCLSDFISKNVEAGATEFRFWSDNCTGQNRNRIVFAAYMLLAEKHNVTIKHTFLEKGHTQQEGDSVHALVERCAKNKLIYTPFEWFTLVRWAKQDGNPYTVIEMDHRNFYDFKSTITGKNWSKNIRGDGVQWIKIKELKVLPEDPNRLHYKYDLTEPEYMTIVTKSNTRRQRRQEIADVVGLLYTNKLTISKPKKDDLISLCTSGVIPSIHHNFYANLAVESNPPHPDSENDSD